MKIAFSTLACPNSSWQDIVSMAKDLGFDGIEIRGLGDDISAVCAELHIHRNTLNYRLNRLEELTSKNPRRGKDLLELYLTALRIKTGEGGTGREGG